MSLGHGAKIITDELVLNLDAKNIKCHDGFSQTVYNGVDKTHTGTLTANVWNDIESFVFNGTDTYISMPTAVNATCTWSVWAKTPSTPNSKMLFNAGANGAGPDLFFVSGNIYWNTWDSTNNPFGAIPSNVADGNFHNYVVINESGVGTKLYYDGELIGTATYKDASTNSSLYIGGTTSTYQWLGNIATFTIHNSVLSETEIKQNFNALRGRFGI